MTREEPSLKVDAKNANPGFSTPSDDDRYCQMLLLNAGVERMTSVLTRHCSTLKPT